MNMKNVWKTAQAIQFGRLRNVENPVIDIDEFCADSDTMRLAYTTPEGYMQILGYPAIFHGGNIILVVHCTYCKTIHPPVKVARNDPNATETYICGKCGGPF